VNQSQRLPANRDSSRANRIRNWQQRFEQQRPTHSSAIARRGQQRWGPSNARQLSKPEQQNQETPTTLRTTKACSKYETLKGNDEQRWQQQRQGSDPSCSQG
jgi:hypothetical protein